MHCPNCGTSAASEQKYCRSCGLELQAIQQLVARQLSEVQPLPRQNAQVASLAWQLFAGVAIMFTGAALLALEKRHFFGAPAGLIGLLLTIGGPLLALHAVLAPLLYPQKPARQQAQPNELIPKQLVADTTSKLALSPGAEPVLSVTEHTTRTLEPVVAKSGDLA